MQTHTDRVLSWYTKSNIKWKEYICALKISSLINLSFPISPGQRLAGLVVWFSPRVREVTGSIPVQAQLRKKRNSTLSIYSKFGKKLWPTVVIWFAKKFSDAKSERRTPLNGFECLSVDSRKGKLLLHTGTPLDLLQVDLCVRSALYTKIDL